MGRLAAKYIKNLFQGDLEARDTVAEPERITEDRIIVLSSIGFNWYTRQATYDASWEKRFQELIEYKAIHGHCNVPPSAGVLGIWVKTQRVGKRESDLKKLGKQSARKKPPPCLSQDRINKLESIGFQWQLAKPKVDWNRW
jgi:hypothetical protein